MPNNTWVILDFGEYWAQFIGKLSLKIQNVGFGHFDHTIFCQLQLD